MDAKRTKGVVGVIDIGYRDTNVALFNNGRYAGGRSIPGGMIAALREIKRLVSRVYGLEMSEHEIDAAVQRGSIHIAGEDYPLPQGTNEELHKGLSGILGAARSIWPSGGKTLEAVVLGGGGATSFGASLRQAFPQLVVPYAPPLRRLTDEDMSTTIMHADPQMAGARGFAAAASAMLKLGQ